MTFTCINGDCVVTLLSGQPSRKAADFRLSREIGVNVLALDMLLTLRLKSSPLGSLFCALGLCGSVSFSMQSSGEGSNVSETAGILPNFCFMGVYFVSRSCMLSREIKLSKDSTSSGSKLLYYASLSNSSHHFFFGAKILAGLLGVYCGFLGQNYYCSVSK